MQLKDLAAFKAVLEMQYNTLTDLKKSNTNLATHHLKLGKVEFAISVHMQRSNPIQFSDKKRYSVAVHLKTSPLTPAAKTAISNVFKNWKIIFGTLPSYQFEAVTINGENLTF